MAETQKIAAKKTRKFLPASHYNEQLGNSYYLLPFRFQRISIDREIIVNEIGDCLIVPIGTAARIIEKNITLENDPELFNDLMANFFISTHPIPELLEVISTRYRTKKSFLDNFTSLHIFVITLRCEHTCHYCQVSRVTADRHMFDMKEEHIDEGILMMMRSPSQHVTMEFQGGESLLAFDKIQYAVTAAKLAAESHNKKITFVVCTNLAPITDDMLHFFKENNVLISTSLDGPSFIHNSNRHKPRGNSYDLAVNGIMKCREILGEDNVSALLTTTNLSLSHPEEIVDEYVKLGFRNIFLRPVSPYGFATKGETKNKYQTSLFIDFYKKALSRIIDHNLNGYFIREDYASIILKKVLTPFPVGYVDLQSPAGLINSVIVFNYDGKIYASDEARMLAEMDDSSFLLGSLGEASYNDIFYGNKSACISEVFTNESLAGCSDCAFQTYCGADPIFNHATQGDPYGFRPTNLFCERNMEIIRHLLTLLDSNKKNENIFRTWITGRS